MADKKPWLGKETLPTVWVWICVLFNIVGILALLMLIIAELVIIVNDFSNYKDQYGQSYPARGYVGEVGCGYVAWTNAPKHTGSAVWMILYQISIIIFASIVIASDLAWRSASYNQWGGHYVEMFYAGGVMAGEHNKGLFYYVVANGFLKMFIVVLYMSQSFYGLPGGSHDPGDLSRVSGFATVATPATAITTLGPTTTTVVVGAAAQTGTIITGQNGGTLYVRSMDALTELAKRVGPDPNDPAAAYGTELWAQWAGWILLGSIIPSIIAFMFLVPWAAKKNEENKPEDAEKGKS